jgi:microcystin-dependent protein/cytoskeletal protein CcmA (bactofilin family)
MAYEVNFTDSVNKGSITVDDNSLNTETSLGLPGRNLSDYGNIVLENFLHLLENFANNNSPNNPVEGQLWYDNTDGVDQLKIYDGAQWISAGGIKKGTAQPEATVSILGDLWVDTSNQQVYLYTGSGWILVGPEFAAGANTGAKYVDVIATNNVVYPVIINYVNNVPISIISGTEFTPKTTIPGFSTIKLGVNVSSSSKYYGTSEKTENLLVSGTSYPGTAFARLDANNIFTRPLRVRNNGGISIGETPTLTFSVSGSITEIRNAASDGSIDFKVNNSGVSTTALRIFNNTKVAIGSPTKIPTEALDVVGNIVSSGSLVINDTSTSSLTVSGGASILRNLQVTGDVDIAGDITVSDILPNSGAGNIGTSLLKFNNIYANNFYGNLIGNLTGSITGSSATAGKLNSSTTFSMIGDITAPSFIFDGQTGGTTKTFTTTLSDTFFTAKTKVTTVESTDEVLIRRPADAALYRIDQEKIVSVIPNTATGPIVPVGTITMYGGTTAPSGWFICTGAEYSTSTYEALFNVIGTSFGTPSVVGVFKIPDFRGRLPLGLLGTATTGNRVLNDGAATTIGGVGGSERELIAENQIPDHYHTLQGDAGTQFYAITNVTGTTDSESVPVSITGGAAGSGLPRTDSIDNFTAQEEFDTVPPFATINFIIYHGVF